MNERGKKLKISSILALSLDGDRLRGCVLRRGNGTAEVVASLDVTLSVNPLSQDPELVGREIRQSLDAAGIRERRCALCLPVGWALSTTTQIPSALPESEWPGFLEMEAERTLSAPPETLVLDSSQYKPSSDGDSFVTLLGMSREHMERLEAVLKAARLQPVTFTLGLPLLQGSNVKAPQAALLLYATRSSVSLMIRYESGVVTLRSIDQAVSTEGANLVMDALLLSRELRITLGQIPAGVRSALKTVQLYGEASVVDRLATDLSPRLQSLGLAVNRVTRYGSGEFPLALPVETEVSDVMSLGTRLLSGQWCDFEFLPPKISAWQNFASRYSAKKLIYVAGLAAVCVVGVGVLFAIQQVELSKLRNEWASMGPKVRELETLQQEIKQFRPWFDESFRSLRVLRQLSEAFPEEGSVTAKTIEIREGSPIVCSGSTQDVQALYKATDKLRASSDVSELQMDQVRGDKPPLQFSFNFHWGDKNQNAQ